MKALKLTIIVSCLISAFTCSAAKYQIKVLNTPTITIDNREAKVGDWFNDQSVIIWSRDNQAMRVVSDENKVYTLSAKLYKEAKAKKFSDFILYTKPLAARGTKDLDLIEQLAERFDNTFVMLDEIVIDISSLGIKKNDYFIFESINEKPRNGQIIMIYPSEENICIKRSDIVEESSNVEFELVMKVTFYPIIGVPSIIIENFDIDVLPVCQE